MAEIEEGAKAPAFNLPSTDGKKIALKDLVGKNVVLYFYPKDDTPGCTREACQFRDSISKLEKVGAVVLGVSPDNLASHEKFVDKYKLPFPLLSDEDHKVAEKYGVWREKKNYGRTYMGIVRSTFIVDKEGRLAKVFSNVKVDGHDAKVLEELKALE
jgi:peroxiredoxin Q/BCP